MLIPFTLQHLKESFNIPCSEGRRLTNWARAVLKSDGLVPFYTMGSSCTQWEHLEEGKNKPAEYLDEPVAV